MSVPNHKKKGGGSNCFDPIGVSRRYQFAVHFKTADSCPAAQR